MGKNNTINIIEKMMSSILLQILYNIYLICFVNDYLDSSSKCNTFRTLDIGFKIFIVNVPRSFMN